jgi:hypothetical protein
MSDSEVASADSRRSVNFSADNGDDTSSAESGQQQIHQRDDVQPTLADIRGLNARESQDGSNIDNYLGQLEVVTDASEDEGGSGFGSGAEVGRIIGCFPRPTPSDDGDGPLGKLPKDTDPELREAKQEAYEAVKDMGLQVQVSRNEDGEIEYQFYYRTTENNDEIGERPQSERHEVLTTTDGDYEEQLEQLQRDQIKDMEQTFNVDINTNVGQVRETEDRHYTTRLPNFGEMHALEDALYRSQPDTLTGEDGERLRINFVDEKDGEGTGGFHHRWSHEVTMVNFSEFSTESQQKVIEHEIAHHGQSVHDDGDDHASDEYYSSLGYTRLDNEDSTWAVRATDNQLFTHDRESGNFYRRNQEGDYLDAEGNVVEDMEDAEQLNGAEMAQRATVPHVHGGYPSNPREMDAEAHAYLRHSSEYREQLYNTSPDLYFAVKERDQEQINTAYGVNEDGTPKWIREPNGTLVENRRENQQVVADYEMGLAEQSEVAEEPGGKRKGHGFHAASSSCCG